ncbi:MAG TPA: Gmad2 immunoglobulin-like domain-containing protein [Candidatus Limnocylindria bacterium]|nr:Gmad2 immunoglobulin-like domain-containing protein [Candidatus Limnocylindria bacterium]
MAVLIVALTVFVHADRVSVADEGNVEQRIAQFWQRVNAMSPGDYIGSADLGQWALNLIERDSRARLTVADFRASTAGMQAALDRAGRAPIQLVYFARDSLPPVGVSAAPPSGNTSADRISARVRALWDARAPGDAGNFFRPHTGGTSLANVITSVSGDTATVVIDAGTWESLSSAEGAGLIDQLVYLITEEPGIRRAALREPGKDHAVIGNEILKDALTREDVNGYEATTDGRLVAVDEEVPATATTTVSNDTIAPALGRLAIELRGAPAPSGGYWSPRFTADLRLNDDPAVPGKWILQITLPSVTDAAAGSRQEAEGTPILEVRTAAQPDGVAYSISLSDARPWRVSVEPGSATGTMRVLVDIGGHPQAVANGTAVYSPRPGATVSRDLNVIGVARAFEATGSWRVRDSSGREVAKGIFTTSVGTSAVWGTFAFRTQLPATVSGNVTLEVFQASARDGSDVNKVEIPLQIQ